MHYTYALMPIVFLIGIIMIFLEDTFKINKGAIAILMSISLWLLLMLGAPYILIGKSNPDFTDFLSKNPELLTMPKSDQVIHYLTNDRFIYHLGNVAETLFFVMGSMLIVNIVDKHGGFRTITDYVITDNKRKLLWYLTILSFFLSALLDNLAAAIVLIAILRKIVPDQTDRMKYACMIIISANAGGSWSPIGDVTTLLLWTGGYISALHQVSHVIIPALVNFIVPTTIANFWLFKKGAKLRQPRHLPQDSAIRLVRHKDRVIIFWLGIISLAIVPFFQAVTGLPPFLSVMLGLALLWIYTDVMHGKSKTSSEEEDMIVTKIFEKIDLSTIFFFLGILMSVAALETGGQLHEAAAFVDYKLHSPFLLSSIIGVVSSFTDNVALVAGTMGMYPLSHGVANISAYAQNFLSDGLFWTTTAYCAVTGGSLLIIGSATGVTVMGLEKIPFTYYLKRFSILALIGYVSGIGVLLLQQNILN